LLLDECVPRPLKNNFAGHDLLPDDLHSGCLCEIVAIQKVFITVTGEHRDRVLFSADASALLDDLENRRVTFDYVVNLIECQ
jgi:hypothetical protein